MAKKDQELLGTILSVNGGFESNAIELNKPLLPRAVSQLFCQGCNFEAQIGVETAKFLAKTGKIQLPPLEELKKKYFHLGSCNLCKLPNLKIELRDLPSISAKTH